MDLTDLFGQDIQSDLARSPSFRGPRPRIGAPDAAGPPSPSIVPTEAPIAPPSEALPSLPPGDIEVAEERVKTLMARMERRARTIYNWIGMAEYAEAHPGEFATFSILDASAVYLLTAPRTPRTAIDAIIGQIGGGRTPTVENVRAEISRAKQSLPRRAEAALVESAAVSVDERGAGGLAALRAVAQLVPSHQRERAIGLLQEAIVAQCGLHDLVSALAQLRPE
jgi:hypothetical protein